MHFALLQQAVEGISDLRHVRITNNILRHCTGQPIMYPECYDLFLDSAIHYNHRESTGAKRCQVQRHEITHQKYASNSAPDPNTSKSTTPLTKNSEESQLKSFKFKSSASTLRPSTTPSN
jgi:hypothetical protein